LRNILLWIAVSLFLVVLFRNAWVSDDAYITLRTVDNFVNGYGLTWNTFERVQTYTHPLWMMLLTSVYFFTREAFFTTIIISMIVSLAAVWLIAFRISRTTVAALLAMCLLILSKSFIDFSTSGLENPLTHFLVALFYWIFFKCEKNLRSLTLLTLVASLATTNRPDTLLLIAPALAVYVWRLRSRTAAYALLVGSIPLALWEAFSFFYYGFLFPNTAYAKLQSGVTRIDLIEQGFYYLLDSLRMDPLTAGTISIAILLVLLLKRRTLLPFAAGILLYLAYVVNIGGCFMSGRYLSAPFVTAVMILSTLEPERMSRWRWGAVFALFILIAVRTPLCPIYTGSVYGLTAEQRQEFLDRPTANRGITDEKAFYFQSSSLLTAGGDKEMPDHEWAEQGRSLRQAGAQLVTKSTVGYFGYFAGPKIVVLDDLALGNPLLARLPIPDKDDWAIGHFRREIPKGYVETIRFGDNLIEHDSLGLYYDKLSLVIQGDLMSFERLWTAVKLNLGLYDHYLEAYSKGSE